MKREEKKIPKWCMVDGRDCWVVENFKVVKRKMCDNCIYRKNAPILRTG